MTGRRTRPLHAGARAWAGLGGAALLAGGWLAAWGLGPPIKAGMESRFVHRIKLHDGEDRAITAQSREPYSTRHTCGKCHDYDRIAGGTHFRAEGSSTRPGEPWILADASTGTQVPLAHPHAFAAPGTPSGWLPSSFGLTDWEFAIRFGRHHPGGGPLDWWRGKPKDAPDEAAPRGGPATSDLPRPPRPSWRAAGSLEIDCLLCHSVPLHDTERRWDRLRDFSFRWAATAAAGLGTIQGSLEEFLAEQGEEEGTAPDAKAPAPGLVVRYDPARFDPEGKVLLDLTRRPPARNCLYCHAARMPGDTGGASDLRDRDVHVKAGLACTDCHRNDIAHRITRGDASAEDLARHPDNATLSCRGCHEAGRLGAPDIAHRGLPAFHLDRIACATCHSGPRPRPGKLPIVQTARAHALGLLTKEDLDQRTRPAVQAPVFKRDADGVVRPYFAMWPAWWGERRDGKVSPIPLQRVREAVGKPAGGIDVLGALRRLKTGAGSVPVYVAGGRIYAEGSGGGWDVAEGESAAPRFWPLAHDVRPARQALGAAGCGDCHAADAPFYYGDVAADPPGPDGRAASMPMRVLLGEPAAAVRLGATAVFVREIVTRRLALWIVAGILALTLLHCVALARRPSAAPVGAPEAGPTPAFAPLLSWIHAASFFLFLVLAGTAVGFVLTYGPSPVPGFFSSRGAVDLHAVAGLAFAGTVGTLVVCWLAIGVARGRADDWLRRWGGFLWMAPSRGGEAAGGWKRAWVWFDAACCLAMAASGIVMALRVPAVGAVAGEAWTRAVEIPALTAAAYAVHGLAGSALIVRLAAHLYARIICGRRGL